MKTWMWIAVVVLVGAAAYGVAYFIMKDDKDKPATTPATTPAS